MNKLATSKAEVEELRPQTGRTQPVTRRVGSGFLRPAIDPFPDFLEFYKERKCKIGGSTRDPAGWVTVWPDPTQPVSENLDPFGALGTSQLKS